MVKCPYCDVELKWSHTDEIDQWNGEIEATQVWKCEKCFRRFLIKEHYKFDFSDPPRDIEEMWKEDEEHLKRIGEFYD